MTTDLPRSDERTPHPGATWWWPTECAKCFRPLGPVDPDTKGSEMTHIRIGGAIDFETNKDHEPVTEGVNW